MVKLCFDSELKMFKVIVMLLLLLVSTDAKEIRVAFSYSTPPYVFKDGSGIVSTIVKEALAKHGHTVKAFYVNIGRAQEMLKNGHIDVATIIQDSSGLQAHYSDYFMQYHNAAFVLNQNPLSIRSIEDLSRYDTISFQGAHIFLGPAYGEMARKAGKKYREIADQKQQVHMLLRGRAQVAIMDRHIFEFYKNQLIAEKKVDPATLYRLIELFPPTRYQCAFKDPKIRDDFNRGLKDLKKSGRYEQIYNEYSSKYFKVKQ